MDLQAAVYGVNPQSAESHLKFRAKHKLPFPLLVDQGGKIASLFQSGGLFARRTVYAIDAGGVICLAQRGMPTSSEILAALKP